MKLILFVAVVMFKCSRLSSAPADSATELNDSKNLSENDYVPNQPAYIAERPPSLSYVSDTDELGSAGVVFQFRRSIKSDNTEIEARRRSALDKGFMRFGRAGSNMLRFGRSPSVGPVGPDEPMYELEDTAPVRMRKNDKNIMRFGRARNDGFMRFGRDFNDDPEAGDYNDASEVDDFVDRPNTRNNRYDEHGNKILRLGRSSSESGSMENADIPLEIQPSSEKTDGRNGNKKSDDRNLLRFGRAGNMMRFGRGNVMRFGKRANMLRFGRGNDFETPKTYIKVPSSFVDPRQVRGGSNDRNLLRLGRAGNLIRFGRNDKNLMRFGKRSGPQALSSSTRFYCKDDNCVLQENENQFADNDNAKSDRLQELFGSDPSKQGYGEYIIDK